MKKLFPQIVSMVLIVCSCQKNDIFPHFKHSIHHSVKIEDVLLYLSDVKGITDTKSYALTIDPIIRDNDTIMFLVNYENGWEVLSGDKRISKVLIKSEYGNITLDDICNNLSGDDYISKLSESLHQILRSNDFPEDYYFSDNWDNLQHIRDSNTINSRIVKVLLSSNTTNLITQTKDHLMLTHWGQGYPWNILMPYTDSSMTQHCYSGCVPVAIAQVLYYLHNTIGVPESTYGFGTCNNAYIPSDQDSLILQPTDVWFSGLSSSHWTDMPLDASEPNGAGKVSALMLRIGYLIAAEYKRDATSASMSSVYYPLAHFGISCQTTFPLPSFEYLTSAIQSNIYENEIPVLLSIADTSRNTSHCVAIDGYQYIKNQITNYYAYYITGEDGRILIGQQPDSYGTIVTEEESYYVAVNWGWDGAYDSSANGTIWYNLANEWIISTRNYSQKRSLIHSLAAIPE